VLLRRSAAVAVRWLAALAIGLHHWFAADVVAGHLELPGAAATAMRTAAFAPIAVSWPPVPGIRRQGGTDPRRRPPARSIARP
jgi:hypothetical protein